MKSLHPCNSDLQRLRDRRHRLEEEEGRKSWKEKRKFDLVLGSWWVERK